MRGSSRRIFWFVIAFFGGLTLLVVLLQLFAQKPRPITRATQLVTSTPHIVATVDGEPILFHEWWQAAALDQVMSSLVGQAPPSAEETLNRLINERLVLRAANSASVPEADQAQAQIWLSDFLAGWGLEDATLERALTDAGLARADLTRDIIPRLLRAQSALETLPPDEDGEAWVAEMRRQAKVEVLETLTASASPRASTTSAAPAATASRPLEQSTPPTSPPSTGPRVGDMAPDFTLQAIDGATVRLFDLRGQPVLLNFWATWCAPCRQELPMLEAAQDNRLVVLGIAVREPLDAVTEFAADLELQLPLLLDQNGQASDAYTVRGLPTSLFVDHEGVIVARHIGPLDPATLDSHLNALLATLPMTAPTP